MIPVNEDIGPAPEGQRTKQDASIALTQNLTCRSCGLLGPWDYVASDETWAKAGLDRESGFVCLSCLDLRIQARRGSPLNKRDFPEVMANATVLYGINHIAKREENE
jgi:hypothetical protein